MGSTSKRLAFLGLALLPLGVALNVGASLSYTTLGLPVLNGDIRTWTGGGAYAPLFPTSDQTLGGVPFHFQSDAGGRTAFTDGTLTIPVNLYGVTAAYTLINTAWGSAGSVVGSVTFNGEGGLSYTVNLVVGANVRDHYYGGYCNLTSDPNTIDAVWGSPSSGAHLDMQAFALPTAFQSVVLENIVFVSQGGSPQGKPFLAGATVARTPDGGSTAMLSLLAIGACGLWFRRSSATAH